MVCLCRQRRSGPQYQEQEQEQDWLMQGTTTLLISMLLLLSARRALCLRVGVPYAFLQPFAAKSRQYLHSIEKELGDTPECRRGAAADYEYFLMEATDLLRASAHLYSCFDTGGNPNPTPEMSEVGKRLYNCFYGIYSFLKMTDISLAYMVGFISRGGQRLSRAREIGLSASLDSIILVAMPLGANQERSDFAGLVELTLERPDGRHASRRVHHDPEDLEYYVSNLSVSKPHRRLGLGRSLVSVTEYIVKERLGGKSLHLHVERSNLAAERLYLGMGYKELNLLSQEDKIKEGLENVGYYRKEL